MIARLVFAFLLFGSLVIAQSVEDPAVEFALRNNIVGTESYVPTTGYIPDSRTAVAVAIAVLTPIYGKSDIDSERPWHTGLKDGIWTVVGTFNAKGATMGGSAIIQLDKKTGAVLFVTHGQ